MTRRDDDQKPAVNAELVHGAIIDFVLGEASDLSVPEGGMAAGEARPGDGPPSLDTALELAETQLLFERLRTIEAPASDRSASGGDSAGSDRVSLAVRGAILRRAELRGVRAMSARSAEGFGDARVWLRTMVAAAIFLALMFGWERLDRRAASRIAADLAAAADGQAPLVVLPARPGVSKDRAPSESPGIAPAGGGALAPVAAEALPRSGSPVLDSEFELESAVRASGPGLAREMRAIADLADVSGLAKLVAADNDLALLRLEYRQRFSAVARRRSIESVGGLAAFEDRIQELAAAVSQRVAVLLAEPAGPRPSATAQPERVEQVALALRGLLAAGSTRTTGPHRDPVAACAEYLTSGLEHYEGQPLATALAALVDLAVVRTDPAGTVIATHANRLARGVLEPEILPSHSGGERLRRPRFLRFSTPVPALADAGRVLRLAPAFGAHPVLAHRARLLLFAHLSERQQRQPDQERPDMLAAALYGFGDFVDRSSIDRRLLLWRPRLLDYRTLHHVAWSQFPPRLGWSEFQREMRGLAVRSTPIDVRDAAALLLSLAMNYAAPGVHLVLGDEIFER